MEQSQDKSLRELKWEEKRNNLNKSRLNNPNASTITRINPPIQANISSSPPSFNTARFDPSNGGLLPGPNNNQIQPGQINTNHRPLLGNQIQNSNDQNTLTGKSDYSSYHNFLKDSYKDYVKDQMK